jgi:hypothetical protein
LPGQARLDHPPAWIFVFDTDVARAITPTPIILSQVIATDAPAASHWALDVAPEAAVSSIDGPAGFIMGLARRLNALWPELARTI